MARLTPLWILALLAALLAVAAAPARAATTSVTVDGTQSGRTFDGIGAISGGGGNSRLLRDYPAAQQWTVGNSAVTINGLCLDVVGNATANGTAVDLWTCHGGANQQWTVSNGTLVNPASGRCLDIPGFATANGTALEIWDCNGGANQQWNVPAPS